MLDMNNIQKGLTIVFNGDPCEVIEFLHARTGMKKPTVSTKLKNYRTGQMLDHQFRPNDKIEQAFLEKKTMTFSYKDKKSLVFMDQETYEEVIVDPEVFGKSVALLLEGTDCNFKYFEDAILHASLPDNVILVVTEAPPYAKGNTVSKDMHNVIVETGATVKAPPFIQTGEKIKIKVETFTYMERAKE
ncbi:MAG: elongation factor P [Planctomycetota bacterium]|nr:MAG: elongation factor P [Planctomycetota bacterium]